MSRNGNERKLNFEDIEVKTFKDAMLVIFGNTVPIGVVISDDSEEDEPDERSEYEKGRDVIFDQMTELELDAYDLLDNFVNTEPAGLPECDDSIEARIEHAEWNTEEFRAEIVHVLAEFESAVAYYVTVKSIMPERTFDVNEELEGIQECIDEIVRYAKEVEILERLEAVQLKMDVASVELDDAYEEREALEAQLEELYQTYADDDDECDEDDFEDILGDEDEA
jgi:hypothetical protein